jgi:hypothetical protein
MERRLYWSEIFDAIRPWQTLIGAVVAVSAAFFAALIAWKNVGRQIRQAADLEKQRRSRKQIALRAVLPLSLSAISEYGEQVTQAFHNLLGQCVEGSLPHIGVQVPPFPEAPSSTIEALAEFIEYSDTLNIQLFENLLSRIQVLSARTRALLSDIANANDVQIITSYWIETNMIQAASVYAGAARAYDYGRRRSNDLPTDVSWDGVRQALRNMRMYDDDIPRVYEIIDRLAQQSDGPTLG